MNNNDLENINIIELKYEDIINTIDFNIKILEEKQQKEDNFSKFDSLSDFFNGRLGEIAFEKYLQQNQSNLIYRNFKSFKDEDYIVVDEVKYDKYDFIIPNFKDEKLKNITLTFDIKTQSYRSENITINAQFGINSNNINNKRNNLYILTFNSKPIDYFKDKLNTNSKDSIDLLNQIKQSIRKEETIIIKIIGIISSELFKKNSLFLENKTYFRTNLKDLKKFSTQSPMYFILIKQLTPLSEYFSNLEIQDIALNNHKLIEPLKINIELNEKLVQFLNNNNIFVFNFKSKKLIEIKDKNGNIFKLNIDGQLELYTIQQFDSLKDFIENIIPICQRLNPELKISNFIPKDR